MNEFELKIRRLEKENQALRNRNTFLYCVARDGEAREQSLRKDMNVALQRYSYERQKREELELQLQDEKSRNFKLSKKVYLWEEKGRDLSNELGRMTELGTALKEAKKRILELEKKLNIRKGTENPYGINTPSSRRVFRSNTTGENFAKRGGAVEGHKGYGRKAFSKDEADEVRYHDKIPEQFCCEAPELLEIGLEHHSHIDFVPMKLKIVYDENRVMQCTHCGTKFTASTPDTLPKAKYSNQAIAMMAQEIYFHQVPIGVAARRFKVNKGTYIGIMHRLAEYLHPLYFHLLEKIKECDFVHADETSWRMDGKSGYAWLLANDAFKIFLFRDTRSSQVPLEIFGNVDLDLILVTDRYCGYNPLKVKHQYCFVHIIRDLKKLTLEFSDDPEIKRFRSDLMPLLKKAIRLKKIKPSSGQYRIRAKKLKTDIMTICRQAANHPGVQSFQDIFRKNEDRLFQWVDHPDVPCENNYAERNLRPIVISRKLSFGCQSERGMKTREIIMSVLHTAYSRGMNIQLFLEAVLNAICRNAHSDIISIFTDLQHPTCSVIA
mgnify:FL=1